MIIKHLFENNEIEKQSQDPGFMITNRNGSYYSYSQKSSRYDGFFIYENNNMYRILDDIVLDKDIDEILNKFSHIELKRGNVMQQAYMFKNHKSLILNFNKHVLINLLFDVKKTYDNRNFGRFYEINEENGKIIIKFDKKTCFLDNENDGKHEYSMYIVINESTHFKPNSWVKKHYPYDAMRNSMPYDRHVFQGLRLINDILVISASTNKSHAINENNYIVKNMGNLIEKQENHLNQLLSKFKHNVKSIDFAYKCCVNALDQLSTDGGLLAGLPWFFQFWPRDELTSCKSLSLINKHLSNFIINRNLHCLIKNNKFFSNTESANCSIPSKHYDKLESKDAIGYLVLRAYEQKQLNYRLIRFLMNIANDSMIENKELETWMDTSNLDDTRSGYRLEIQAMYLRIYSILYKVTKSMTFKEIEQSLLIKVRIKLLDGKILKDGENDTTIRPNIFIAYYFYPELLSKDQWDIVFNNSIPELWNEWGGFSTIQKSSYLYQQNYTGENNKSYHRGDSWFYLNNMGAICLYKQDKIQYKKFIDKILQASVNDILWNGYIGFHSEISSSSDLVAVGCKAQAWSSALFIELIKEISK